MISNAKYIRTKDYVYEPFWVSDTVYATKRGLVHEEDILARSANLICVCDYVIKKPYGAVSERAFVLKEIIHKGYLDRNNYEEVKTELEEQFSFIRKGDKSVIYLAIETDKGLIYVAESDLDEEGGWRLL